MTLPGLPKKRELGGIMVPLVTRLFAPMIELVPTTEPSRMVEPIPTRTEL